MATVGDTAHTLKFWREVAEIKQQELAELADVHNSTISGYETGGTVPLSETVRKVTAALGMTQADREETESFVRQTRLRLKPTALGEGRTDASIADSSRGTLQWRSEANQVVQDGSRFVSRLLRLVLSLLVSIAEAVVKQDDSNPEAHS